MKDIEHAVERYSRGMGHLRQQLPIPGPPQVVLVTHRRDVAMLGRSLACPETVAQTSPSWGSSVPAPASWDLLPAQQLEVRPTMWH